MSIVSIVDIFGPLVGSASSQILLHDYCLCQPHRYDQNYQHLFALALKIDLAFTSGSPCSYKLTVTCEFLNPAVALISYINII